MNQKHMFKRIAAAFVAVLIALMQAFFLLPENVNAGGDNLSIRVQYAAEPGAKIREKAVISRSELAGMSNTYCYSNVTSVGTVMVMKANGAKVTDILQKADIDIGSVKLITFRTDDGYTRNISKNRIIGYGYYYPKLNLIEKKEEPDTDPTQSSEDPTKPSSDPTQPSEDPTKPSSDPTQPSEDPTQPSEDPNPEPTAPAGESGLNNWFFDEVYAEVKKISYYERTDSGRIIPQEGFDTGAEKVPAILALEFGSSKAQGKSAESLSMSSKRSYRFCIGQTKLETGKKTTGSDVTSMDSAYHIYGIDVTLEGYPVKGVRLSVDNPGKMVVGSKKTVKAVIDGDSLFSEYVDVDTLVWSSSDTSIATVNQKGVVTIKKKGEVTITATAKGGIEGSIVLGSKEGKASAKDVGKTSKKSDTELKEKDKVKKKTKTPSGKLLVREIHIGDEITKESIQETASQMQNDSNVQALDEVEPYSKKTAAGAAAGALCLCGGGAAFRIRRFMKEV